jgi:DNA polymerase
MENSIYKDIAAALKTSLIFKDFTVVKKEDELSYLDSWLSSKPLSKNEKPLETKGVLKDIKDIIDTCNLCEKNSEKQYSFGDGISGIMIILNSPTLMSDVEREVYKTDSQNLMKKMVESLGKPFDKCYTTNLIKCTVKNAILKPSDVLNNCVSILKNEMEFVNPKIIIVMGDIIPIQNIVHSSRGIFWYTIEHPITILKNPELKRKTWNTLKVVIEKMKELDI